MFLSKSQPQSIPHSTIHLHLYHSLSGLHGSGLSSRRSSFRRLIILLHDGRIEIIDLYGFGAYDILCVVELYYLQEERDKSFVSQKDNQP
jgi:hypothetical protein